MLRLPAFEVVSPETVAGVVTALARPGARLIAGGTDLLPNLKHRLDRPPVLVSLTRVRGLRQVAVDRAAGVLRIGAGMTLSEVSTHPEVTGRFPSLATAAGIVASPLLRNMGTIGGNIHLDTRCRYVNQTEFWRGAIGGLPEVGRQRVPRGAGREELRRGHVVGLRAGADHPRRAGSCWSARPASARWRSATTTTPTASRTSRRIRPRS